MPTDSQSQTGPTVLARGTAVDLVELFKDVLQRLLGNTNTGVGNRHDECATVRTGGDSNRSGMGKFDRVAQEIHQDLLHLVAIRQQRW